MTWRRISTEDQNVNVTIFWHSLLGAFVLIHIFVRKEKGTAIIMLKVLGATVSCRNLFRRSENLPFVSQYILLLMLFVVKNKNLFILYSENHTKCTKQFNNFYQPIINFTIYQRGVHYMGIKIFNNLPPRIKDIPNNVGKFEFCLKWFLQMHSFYPIEEYLQHKSITNW